MSILLDVQNVSENIEVPNETEFKNWIKAIPTECETSACLRVVDEPEAKSLNKQFRKIDKATNVLSFPADVPEQLDIKFLGDIVICAPIVTNEAQQQGKQINDHWAHLLIHGILHLQGHDHKNEIDAHNMESLEIDILKNLGIPNPYE